MLHDSKTFGNSIANCSTCGLGTAKLVRTYLSTYLLVVYEAALMKNPRFSISPTTPSDVFPDPDMSITNIFALEGYTGRNTPLILATNGVFLPVYPSNAN